MLRIETKNETPEGYDMEIQIVGPGSLVVQQMVTALDKMYKVFPELFERALLLSKYTEDHT